MNLQNFKCSLSGSEKLYTLSSEIPFLNRDEWGLNLPQISLPYNNIGLIVWSKICRQVLTEGWKRGVEREKGHFVQFKFTIIYWNYQNGQCILKPGGGSSPDSMYLL